MKRLAVETEMEDWSHGRAEGSGAAGENANYASSVVSSGADLQAYHQLARDGIVGSGIQLFSKSKNCCQALHNSAATQILLGPFCRTI